MISMIMQTIRYNRPAIYRPQILTITQNKDHQFTQETNHFGNHMDQSCRPSHSITILSILYQPSKHDTISRMKSVAGDVTKHTLAGSKSCFMVGGINTGA